MLKLLFTVLEWGGKAGPYVHAGELWFIIASFYFPPYTFFLIFFFFFLTLVLLFYKWGLGTFFFLSGCTHPLPLQALSSNRITLKLTQLPCTPSPPSRRCLINPSVQMALTFNVYIAQLACNSSLKFWIRVVLSGANVMAPFYTRVRLPPLPPPIPAPFPERSPPDWLVAFLK